MDLHSQQDMLLLKRCIFIKSKLEKKQEDLDYFQDVYMMIKDADSSEAIYNLISKEENGPYSSFYEHIRLTPSKELYKEYITFMKSTLNEMGLYSEKKFIELKNAFSRGIEGLIGENQSEEKCETKASEHSAACTKKTLENLDYILKNVQFKNISAAQFKEFASSFRDNTKSFGIEKLQESFDKTGQKISDMKISYENPSNPNTYKIDFTLVDHNSVETHQILTGRACPEFNSTYFQYLCYSYLEADKCSSMDENLLSSDIISEKIQTFSDCYKRLKEMSQYNLTISSNNTNNPICPSTTSSDEPFRDNDILQEIYNPR